MKFNKWTLGLAAVGAVSMASAVRADETPKLDKLNTAISNTTISGVVDVAAQYNTGDAHYNMYVPSGTGSSKVDSFSVNQVIISLDKPLDESPWASGYHIDLNWGSDAITPEYDDIRQAYVTVRTPVGNGIDWKMGLFDNVIGYESNTMSANPNYTHSYGWNLEPTSQLGLVGTYKVCNELAVTAGIANSYSYYGYGNVSAKTYLGAVTLTAPDSWGWAKGAALTAGINQAFTGNSYNYYSYNKAYYPSSTGNYYAGLTMPTPIKALKLGLAFDLVGFANENNSYSPYNHKDDNIWVVGAYATFQATDKLSLSVRGEYLNGSSLGQTVYGVNGNIGSPLAMNKAEEVTITAQYNLWQNVISRVEFRWDHLEQGTYYGYANTYYGDSYYSHGARSDAFQIALNLAYQF